MRTYTLVCSIVVHVVLVAAFILAPVLAPLELPVPRRAFDAYTIVEAFVPPPEPPPPARARAADARSTPVSGDAAPMVAPDTIEPDTGIDQFETEGMPHGVAGGVGHGVDGGLGDRIEPMPPPPPVEQPRAALRVGGSIKAPKKIRHVAPVYPAMAQAASVQGTVILEAVISEDGRVRNLRVLRSVRLLDQAAIDAVRQWQFTPTLLNGEPVPVVMTVTVTFALSR